MAKNIILRTVRINGIPVNYAEHPILEQRLNVDKVLSEGTCDVFYIHVNNEGLPVPESTQVDVSTASAETLVDTVLAAISEES